MSESTIQAEIFRAIGSRPDCRIWRNNVGQAWTGEFIARHPNGSVLLGHARPLHSGLFKGSADLIGIGPTGRFLSLEIKSASGRPTVEQILWRDAILRAGGIAGIVRSVAEAEALLI